MKSPAYVIAVAVVVGVAAWAYQVNFETQRGLSDLRKLRTAIAAEREAIAVLETEWAYLNRPERLEALTRRMGERLGLMPLDPAHYGEIGMVSFPLDDPHLARPADRMPLPDGPVLPMTLPEAIAISRSSEGAQ